MTKLKKSKRLYAIVTYSRWSDEKPPSEHIGRGHELFRTKKDARKKMKSMDKSDEVRAHLVTLREVIRVK